MLTSGFIKDFVDDYFEIDISKLSQKRHYVLARWIYYRISRDLTDDTVYCIAKTVNLTHSTVVYGLKEFDIEIKQNLEFKKHYEDIFNEIYNDSVFMEVKTLSDLKREYYKQLTFLKKENEELRFRLNI